MRLQVYRIFVHVSHRVYVILQENWVRAMGGIFFEGAGGGLRRGGEYVGVVYTWTNLQK